MKSDTAQLLAYLLAFVAAIALGVWKWYAYYRPLHIPWWAS